ncbi:MAG: hypothetical protein Terrestrivirus1_47 [Terrestrivirus sp.]|uniref:Uncharacterized protein n=1 Tax=Terrestrivirus sp. TaxID=2487775 RepID=A0A3G4ZNI9_9VIRU|nr:MAG: hypothetical protein Terrestrivirus1_47 [Terrestrivirus sp.]
MENFTNKTCAIGTEQFTIKECYQTGFNEFSLKVVRVQPFQTNFENVIKFGTFYCPAYKHYGPVETVVTCDRCHKTNLVSCIGFDKLDVCLKCGEEVSIAQTNKPNLVPFQSVVTPTPFPVLNPAPVEFNKGVNSISIINRDFFPSVAHMEQNIFSFPDYKSMVIGKTIEDAKNIVQNKFPIRAVKINGVSQGVIFDFQSSRMNVSVQDGRIISVDGFY